MLRSVLEHILYGPRITQIRLDQLDSAVCLVLLTCVRRQLAERKLLNAMHSLWFRVVEIVDDWDGEQRGATRGNA